MMTRPEQIRSCKPKFLKAAQVDARVEAEGQHTHTNPTPRAQPSKAPTGPMQIQITQPAPPVDAESSMWISRSLELPVEKRNGWVLSWIVESHLPCIGFLQA